MGLKGIHTGNKGGVRTHNTALLETGTGIPVDDTVQLVLRNVSNTSEIGTVTGRNALLTLLNSSEYRNYGIWWHDGVNYGCTGVAPSRLPAYNLIGSTFERTDADDWSVLEGAGFFTFGNDSGRIRVYSTDTNNYHSIVCNAYGHTLLNDIQISFDVEFVAGTPSVSVGIKDTVAGPDGDREFIATRINIQDYSYQGGTQVIRGAGSGYGTYTVTVSIKGNYSEYAITKNGITDKIYLYTPPSQTEHNSGRFFLRFVNCEAYIANFKITNTCYKNIDHIGVGDSLLWGRDAVTWEQTWFNQLMGTKPHQFYAHGDTGFEKWILCAHELEAVQPANVWIMGSYVNTGSLSDFQTKYAQFIDILDNSSALKRINHFASCPNNFGTDIRPFNNWKAATYNTGIHRFIPESFTSLLQSGTNYNLVPGYESSGSHLNQTGQNVLVAALAAYQP